MSRLPASFLASPRPSSERGKKLPRAPAVRQLLPLGVEVAVLFHLAQMRAPRLREANPHCQSHTAGKVRGAKP